MTPILNIVLALFVTTVLAGADIARTPQKDIALPTPAPTVMPTPIRTYIDLSTPKPLTVEETILDVFGDKGSEALKVAFCESSLNPKSQHKTSSATGLFQIMKGTWKQFKCIGDPLNALDNTKCAKKIYDYYGSWNTRGGWSASYWCHRLGL